MFSASGKGVLFRRHFVATLPDCLPLLRARPRGRQSNSDKTTETTEGGERVEGGRDARRNGSNIARAGESGKQIAESGKQLKRPYHLPRMPRNARNGLQGATHTDEVKGR